MILILACREPISLARCRFIAYSRGKMHCYAIECSDSQSLVEEIVSIVESYGATCSLVTMDGRVLDLLQALNPSIHEDTHPLRISSAELYTPNKRHFLRCISRKARVRRARIRGSIVELHLDGATTEDLVSCGSIPTRIGSTDLSVCIEHPGTSEGKRLERK